jgi:hypothetical protein
MLGFGQDIVRILGSLFIGFEASPAGLFVGLVWGFFAGGIAGLIFAALYNTMV